MKLGHDQLTNVIEWVHNYVDISQEANNILAESPVVDDYVFVDVKALINELKRCDRKDYEPTRKMRILGEGGLVILPPDLLQEYAIDNDSIDVEHYRIPHLMSSESGIREIDGTYDSIYIMNVLHLMSDPRILINECHRALNPGGKLYVEEINYESSDIMNELKMNAINLKYEILIRVLNDGDSQLSIFAPITKGEMQSMSSKFKSLSAKTLQGIVNERKLYTLTK